MIAIPNRVRVVAVMLALALAGGLVTLALLAKPTQAQPPSADEKPQTSSETLPIEFMIDSTPVPDDPGGCGVFGEYIRGEATWHTVTHFSTDSAGGYHAYSRSFLSNAKGVGLTREDDGTYTPNGTEYVIVSSVAESRNYIPPDGQFHYDTIILSVFIQKGPGTPGDETITKKVGFFSVHLIFNPDGTVKVDNVEFHDQCH